MFVNKRKCRPRSYVWSQSIFGKKFTNLKLIKTKLTDWLLPNLLVTQTVLYIFLKSGLKQWIVWSDRTNDLQVTNKFIVYKTNTFGNGKFVDYFVSVDLQDTESSHFHLLFSHFPSPSFLTVQLPHSPIMFFGELTSPDGQGSNMLTTF